MKRWMIWALCLLGASAPLQARHVKVFVLTGQSNSLGTTKGDGGRELEQDPADTRVPFFWNNCADAKTPLGDSGGKWQILGVQQGGFYPGNPTHWGPEIGFSRSLVKAGVVDFAMIKVSRGGGGNGNWDKEQKGHMYERLVKTVAQASALLTQRGDTYEIAGLLYLQGESDSPEEAKIADVRLAQLADHLRKDLPHAANLKVLIGGIGARNATRDVVRAQQQELAKKDPRVRYFSNDDLVPTLYDGLHFSREARLEIGARFAREAFAAKMVTPHYGKLVFIGDSITQGGNGDHPSYRYEVFKNLANLGVPNHEKNGYRFVGSVAGPYQNSKLTTPDVNGQTFENVHEGHFGWRLSWSIARLPLPVERRGENRGEGTIKNWMLGQKSYQTSQGQVSYPDPAASSSGGKGIHYRADTAVILMGVNDLADPGVSPDQVASDLGTMIDLLRQANPKMRIFVAEVLPANQGEERKKAIAALNGWLPALLKTKNQECATSPVWLIRTSEMDPVTQTYDRLHPNGLGEKVVGGLITRGLGL